MDRMCLYREIIDTFCLKTDAIYALGKCLQRELTLLLFLKQKAKTITSECTKSQFAGHLLSLATDII